MLGKPMLLVSSYAPLFLILAIRFEPKWLVITCSAIAGLGVLCLTVLLAVQRRVSTNNHEAREVKAVGQEAASYLASYLLPFVTIAEPGARDLFAYVAFLLVAGVVSLRSPVIQINPLLYLLGHQVLQVTETSGKMRYVVTRDRIVPGQTFRASLFSDDVLVASRQSPDADS